MLRLALALNEVRESGGKNGSRMTRNPDQGDTELELIEGQVNEIQHRNRVDSHGASESESVRGRTNSVQSCSNLTRTALPG
jgi:hypothetical protein